MQTTTRRALLNLDLLVEIPNIDFTDGYSQSAKPIVFMLVDICKEESIEMRVICKNLAKRNMPPSQRPG